MIRFRIRIAFNPKCLLLQAVEEVLKIKVSLKGETLSFEPLHR